MIKLLKKLWIVIISLIFIFSMIACDRIEPKKTYTIATTEESTKDEIEIKEPMLAVVKSIKSKKKKITFINVKNDEEVTLSYTGGLETLNKYDTVMSISQLDLGEIVDVYYDENSLKISKIKISNDAWEVKGLTRLSVDKVEKNIKVSGKNYKYTNSLFIIDEDVPIELIEIYDKDKVTTKGYKGKICSIIIETGHGYVSLENYDTLIGGTIQIGTEVILPITEDMLMTVPIGTYKLEVEKDGINNYKNIVVKKNKETKVNLVEFQVPATEQSMVLFKIEPEDAILLVDGELRNHNDTVTLNYGEHEINISSEGYNDYVETIVLDEAYMIYNIELAEEETDKEANISSESVEGEDNNNEDNTETTTNGKIEDVDVVEVTTASTVSKDDEKEYSTEEDTTEKNTEKEDEEETTEKKVVTKQKVHITQPNDVKIYLDSEYVGKSPISFTKITGSHIITLSKVGYETKSYTVSLMDDGQDTYFSFPMLLQLEN